MEPQKLEDYIKPRSFDKIKYDKSKFKILLGILLILFAIILYLLIHGTSRLYFVRGINSIFEIIPIFDGVKINNRFITDYAIDVLWIFAFNLLFSIFNNKVYNLFVLFTSLFLELLQLIDKKLGTFDYVDMLIYTVISFFFIIKLNRNKT